MSEADDATRIGIGPHLLHVIFSLADSQEGVAMHEGKAAALPVWRGERASERICEQSVQ